jgi:DNA-binding response OmpR family regulator
LIALGLRAGGYAVIEALNRDEAMRTARSYAEHFDLVLVDGGFAGVADLITIFPEARSS